MMGQVIAYSFAVAAALGAAGYACERIAALRGVPRRLVWTLVMTISFTYPLIAVLVAPRHQAPPAQMQEVRPTATAPSASSEVEPALPASLTLTAPDHSPQTRPDAKAGVATALRMVSARVSRALQRAFYSVPDAYVLHGWAALCALAWIHLLVATVLLRRRAAAWPRARINGQQVLVSEDAGPAVIGVLRPRIVVPRWFLDEPAASQALILAHEQLHQRARDPLLLRAALLAVTLVPWSLPLWWQLRRLRVAIELDCDARVMRAGSPAGDYGAVLLRVAQRSSLVPVGAISMGLPASALEYRIRQLVAAPVRRVALRTATAALLAIAGVAVAVTLDAPVLTAGAADGSAAQSSRVLPVPSASGAVEAPPAAIPPRVVLETAAVPAALETRPDAQVLAAAQSPPAAPLTTTTLNQANAADHALGALLQSYPELLVSDREGWYSAAVVLRADGSVMRSALRFATERTQAIRDILDLRYLPGVTVAPQILVGNQPVPARSPFALELKRPGEATTDGKVLQNHLIYLYAVLPAEYDDHRSLLWVWEGVLARHAELLLPREATLANRVTVLMTEDGRIARSKVDVGTRDEILRSSPDFTALGLRDEDIGVRGAITLTRNDYSEVDQAPLDQQLLRAALWSALGVRDELVVHYAWPRRAGEPVGGWKNGNSVARSGQ